MKTKLDKQLQNIMGSLKLEGFELSKNDIRNVKSVLSGDSTADSVISNEIEKMKEEGIINA